MVIFPGNFVCKTSLGLQCRVLLVPWVKMNTGNKCSRSRVYSSSFPGRYVSRKPSETKEPQTSSAPTEGSKDIEMPNCLSLNEPRVEVSNGKRSSQRGFVWDKQPQSKNRNQNPKLTTNLITDAKPALSEPEEFVPKIGIHLDKNYRNQDVLQVSKPKEDDENFAVELIATRVKMDSWNSCSRGSSHGSSFPIRYPRKISETEEPQTPPVPMKGSKNKEMHNGNVSRVEDSNGRKSSQGSFVPDKQSQNKNRNQSLKLIDTLDAKPDFSEGEEAIYDFGFVDDEFREEPGEILHELKIHPENDHPNLDALQDGKTKDDAVKFAIKLLAVRAFTSVELRKKLHGKRFSLDIVDAVITDFQSRGLINDCLYAETFSQSRWLSSTWGPRRIKQALVRKGINEVDAEKAIKLVFEDGDPGGYQESGLGLSKLSMDHLLVQASKQWLRGCDVPYETRKSRTVRWLQYRGFNWAVIGFILKKLESKCPR